MWKAVLAGTTALVIAGSSLVLAQQGMDRGGGRHWRPSAADVSAFTDARIAALHAGLKLSPDQDKYWPAFESALREEAQARNQARAERMHARAERMQARAERMKMRGDRMGGHDDENHADNEKDQAQNNPAPDPTEWLRKRADRMATTAAGLKKLADAQDPLYKSLDEGQKKRFRILAHMLRPHHGRNHHHHRDFAGGPESKRGHDGSERGFGRGPDRERGYRHRDRDSERFRQDRDDRRQGGPNSRDWQDQDEDGSGRL